MTPHSPLQMPSKTKRCVTAMPKYLYLFMVYAFLYIPIIILVVNAFNASRFGYDWGGFTLSWFSELFNNSSLMEAAWHSVNVAFFAASLSVIIGSLTAIALFRYQFYGKQFVNGMLFIVMMSPDIVMAISLLALFMLMGISLGFTSLVIAHVTFCLPYVVVTVFSRLNGFDAKMLEAAKDLGANEFTIVKKIILPLALPAVISGWLLSFTLSLDDVIVSNFVTGPNYEVLPLKIFSLVKSGAKPDVNALATLLLLVSLILVVTSQLVLRPKKS